MIYQLYQATPSPMRGWFLFGIPTLQTTLVTLELPHTGQMDVHVERHYAELALRARVCGIVDQTEDELFALGVLYNLYRLITARWCADEMSSFDLDGLAQTLGQKTQLLESELSAFERRYPAHSAHAGHLRAFVESTLIQVSLENPAFEPFYRLFGFDATQGGGRVEDNSRTNKLSGPSNTYFQRLMEMVGEAPTDIKGQLRATMERWGHLVPPGLHDAVLRVVDVLNEAHTLRASGPPPSIPLKFETSGDSLSDVEAFTPDRDWMSNVVLVAKQTFVWLTQLSDTYGYPIQRLDEIPDAELKRLSNLGFTGLWLIGIWKRSAASQTIKRALGNPDAIASAYALDEYEIAEELGGTAAYESLLYRAERMGIRLAADMVPNHVGLDGRWVREHPERFVSTEVSPFPNYRFTGPDLSDSQDVSVYLEDGYYDQSDAAVVFKRVQHSTGDVRYIYHGNDGTQMPWNDTAQLNYLDEAVREAVIEQILSVARRFSIIRFDAAMTLAKRHVRRLWYPRPGDGGAIPSRSQLGQLSDEAFEAAMPIEFWRQVVDRINQELPDTLLLAEAFWMMEGYFVRNLGMHRVYNSAFMNMLKREHNGDYRTTIKNTLAYSPEILKRFVNFMNNPDEETAVAQFGRGDKYFGNAIMMCTMPGLPMFGHGQVEGFEEKYGMEYNRPKWSETIDESMVAQHQRVLAPLLHRRCLFAETTNFELYDFEDPEGRLNENVFVYSNRRGDEKVLVLYNNCFESTVGRIVRSVERNVGTVQAPNMKTTTLRTALGLEAFSSGYLLCEELVSARTFILSAADIEFGGFDFQLRGYQALVLRKFSTYTSADGARLREVMPQAGFEDFEYSRLEESLGGFRKIWVDLVADHAKLTTQQMQEVVHMVRDPRCQSAFIDARTVASRLELLGGLSLEFGESQELGTNEAAENEPIEDELTGGVKSGGRANELISRATIRSLLRRDGHRYFDPVVFADLTDNERHVLPAIERALFTSFDSVYVFFESEFVRQSLSVHHHDGVEWFVAEAMELLIEILEAINGYSTLSMPFEQDLDVLRDLAKRSKYRYRDFLFLLKRQSHRVDFSMN